MKLQKPRATNQATSLPQKINLENLLERQSLFIDAATRSSLFIVLFIFVLNQSRELSATGSRLASSFGLCVIVTFLAMLLNRRITLIPYLLVLLVGVFVVTILPLPSIFFQIITVAGLLMAVLKPIRHFEWLFYVIPLSLYLISFGMNILEGQLWSLIAFSFFFILQQLLDFRQHYRQNQEIGGVTQNFSQRELMRVGVRQFERRFLLILVGAALVAGIAAARPSWLSSQFLREQTAGTMNRPRRDQQRSTKTLKMDNMPQSNDGNPASEKIIKKTTHKFPMGVFVAFIVVAVGLVIFLFYDGVRRLFQQLHVQKVIPELPTDNHDIIIGQSKKRQVKADGETSWTRKIRRKYQRSIQKKYAPQKSDTPAVQVTKLTSEVATQEQLQHIYESVRYSQSEPTKDDYRRFNDLLKK